MDDKFKEEILIRLTKIESKLDDHKDMKDKAANAYILSKANEERIKKLEEHQKWLIMTVLGSIIVAVMNLILR